MTDAVPQSTSALRTASALRATRPKSAPRRADASAFKDLLDEVRAAGLLRRRPGYYLGVAVANGMVCVAAIVAMVRLGPTPWQLAVAAVLGVALARFAFLAHEAAHRQVFERGLANDLMARIVGGTVVGLSLRWWQQSHNRHHAHPNTAGRDPSVAPGALVFHDAGAVARSAPRRAFLRIQGWLLLPMLLGEGVNLRVESLRAAIASRRQPGGRTELAVLTARLAALPVLAFLVLPPMLAVGFLAVQSGAFGLYLGGAFVTNHVGMPVLEPSHGLDHLRKQVLTSRNLSGGRVASVLTGGLSLQIEHHLFPAMARPNLLKARSIVRRHCSLHGIDYTETNAVAAFASVIRHLNRVGLAGGGGFRCPIAEECGRS